MLCKVRRMPSIRQLSNSKFNHAYREKSFGLTGETKLRKFSRCIYSLALLHTCHGRVLSLFVRFRTTIQAKHRSSSTKAGESRQSKADAATPTQFVTVIIQTIMLFLLVAILAPLLVVSSSWLSSASVSLPLRLAFVAIVSRRLLFDLPVS